MSLWVRQPQWSTLSAPRTARAVQPYFSTNVCYFEYATSLLGPVVVPAPSSLACLIGVGVLVGLNEWRKKRRLERRAKATA